ncbi:hypothetical protein VA249_14700 [Vibrio alfacsensis]|uniref:hypothetical protein n=1 Tax=Vibrio alfacsensis TaxID=1074311 RepID=UPI001BED50BA|nr:hypothetical protein [Vibrio alfacsensis]BBM64824.1 hypothetical protein VA249_14700 [Vibrio alfacsensis]
MQKIQHCFTLLLLALCNTSYANVPNACLITFNKDSNIDFFTSSKRPLNNGTEGSFTVSAGSEMVKVFVTPTFNHHDDQLSYGSNYAWMIEGNALPQFDVSYSVGNVAADSTYEFKVYPQTLVDLLPAGERTSEINLQVQCIPHSRLHEKYKRIVGFEMIRG